MKDGSERRTAGTSDRRATGKTDRQVDDGLRRRSAPPDAPDEPTECSRCGARFVDDRLLALHRGLEHAGELTEGECAAYEEAVAAERDDVRLFRLKAVVVLLAIYFGFIYLYAFVL